MKALLIAVLLAAVSLLTACRSASACLAIGSQSSKLIRDILQADLATAHRQDLDQRHDPVGELVVRLHQDHSPEADQAAVVLMEFYLGEGPSDDVMEDILMRGKRMIHLVKRLKEGERSACGLAEFESLKLPSSTVQSRLRETLEMLRKGETLNSGL